METFECPDCGAEIQADTNDDNNLCKCDLCSREYKVNYDAEFIDGMWRNNNSLTKL